MDKIVALLFLALIIGLLAVGCGAAAKLHADTVAAGVERGVAQQPAASCTVGATCIDQRQTAVQINAGVAVGNRIEQRMTAQDESATNGSGWLEWVRDAAEMALDLLSAVCFFGIIGFIVMAILAGR